MRWSELGISVVSRAVTLYERRILGSSLATERKGVTENFKNCVKRSFMICAFTKYIRTMKLRRTIWLGRVARVGKNVLYKM